MTRRKSSDLPPQAAHRRLLRVLYRGPLSSCNYGCDYCPFAKQVDSRAQLADDARALERFVDWVRARKAPTSVLFTPWGEALIRRPYRAALISLTNVEHVERAAIQTNLSGDIAWTRACVPGKLGIWATFHPDWADLDAFVAKVSTLHERGIQVSAGVVGMHEHMRAIERLRAHLPHDVYLWVNAYKRVSDYYSVEDIARLERIDGLFSINNRYHPSRGRRCRTGDTVIAVDGAGDARRCHFIDVVIGNIYESGFDDRLYARACTRDTCGCFIGYVHLEDLQLDNLFGPGVLERVPLSHPRRLVPLSVPLSRGRGRRRTHE